MPDKDYQLTTELRPGYLYAKLEADRAGLDIMVGYGNELAAAIRASGVNKVLFENYAPVQYGQTKYSVAASLFRNLVEGRIVFAIVDSRRNDRRHISQATAAAKAAGLEARYFDSLTSAEDWLTSSDE